MCWFKKIRNMLIPQDSVLPMLESAVDSAEQIKSIALEIEILKDKLKQSKTLFKSQLEALFSDPKTENLKQIACDLYWVDHDTGDSVRKTYNKWIDGTFPSVKYFEVGCGTCDEILVREYTSWSKFIPDTSPHNKHDVENIYRGLGPKIECENCRKYRLSIVQREREETEKIYEKSRIEYEEKINTLCSIPYSEYLQTDHWKTFSYKAMKRANFRCQLCNKPSKLNVHHRTYERRGHEEWNDVITLCEWCHSKFHDKLPNLPKLIESYNNE